MSSVTPADDAQRRTVIDPTRSFIVQAPAGSGKTELLIQRYLRLLAVVGEPEEIIAITFTRKAAAEMRSRVLKALRDAEAGGAAQDTHHERTRALALAALARDREREWAVKDNPARLRIQTIDSLCARLVRQMPWLARFGGQLEPLDDASELYLAAARNLLAQLEDDDTSAAPLVALLSHLDNNLGVIEALLAGMLARREQWLRHVVDDDSEAARRERLECALQDVIRGALQDLVARFPDELKDESVKLACFAAKNLKQSGRQSPILACDGIEALPGAEPADLEVWRGIAATLLTGKGEWRAHGGRNIGLPARAKNKLETELCRDNKQAFTALLDACRENHALRDCLKALRLLPAAYYEEEQWRILRALSKLLRMAVAHLDVLFEARGQVDFQGVARRALDALGAPEEPTDLSLMLDHRIRHILIDEFQDTSLTQSQLLAGLIAGWEEGDGRTLFAVGDPMQSIYGFREAEVGVFLQTRKEGIGSVRPASLTLSANFRSQRGIVDWINASFPRVFPAAEDIGAGAVKYTSCDAVHASLAGAAVKVHCFMDRDRGPEAERVVDIIKQARANEPDGRIAILVRGKNHLEAIVRRLNDAGLRFQAVDFEKLAERPIVRDLLALTRVLTHPADRLSWLAALRAPWCGLTLNDLHALAGDDLRGCISDLIADDIRCRRLTADGQRRLARVREVLARSIAQRRRRTLRRQIEGAWLALGGPATAAREGDLDDAQMYLELLDRLDDGGDLTDFGRLQAGVESLYSTPDAHADARLQVMTIHKAKGLEFDTVIVPGLGLPPARDEVQLLTWLERTNRDGEAKLLIAPIGATESEHDPTYVAIRKLIELKTQHEDERLLYVAATRARKYLHLVGHVTLDKDGTCKPAARSLLACLWPAVENDFMEAAANRNKPAMAEAPMPKVEPRLRRFSAAWQLPQPPPGVSVAWAPEAFNATDTVAYDIEFAWAGETARHVGVVAHRLLQRVAREGIDAWDVLRVKELRPGNVAALAALGVSRNQLDDAAIRVEQVVLNTLHSERGRWLFDVGHGDARAEYALSGILDGRLINIKIDRTFVDADGVRWIVDYKIGTHEGAAVDTFLRREEERYRSQLARYAALMRLEETRPIKAGLYYPLIVNGWREWPAE